MNKLNTYCRSAAPRFATPRAAPHRNGFTAAVILIGDGGPINASQLAAAYHSVSHRAASLLTASHRPFAAIGLTVGGGTDSPRRSSALRPATRRIATRRTSPHRNGFISE